MFTKHAEVFFNILNMFTVSLDDVLRDVLACGVMLPASFQPFTFISISVFVFC